MKQQKLILMSLFILSFLASGCAKDRNADDYLSDKASQETVKNQKVAGDYVGTLTDSQGNTQGAIDIQLTVASRNSTSNDGASIAQSYLIGSVSLLDTPNTYAAITSATFTSDDSDSANGKLSAAVQLKDDNGTAQTLQINGTISGDNFTGTIISNAYSHNSLNFNASRSISKTSANVQNAAKVSGAATSDLNYEGTLILPTCAAGAGSMRTSPAACTITADLRIDRDGSHSDQNFFNFFSVSKSYDVDLNFFMNTTLGQKRISGQQFAGATLDVSGAHPRLIQESTGSGSTGAGNGSNRLNCTEKSFENGKGWSCDIVIAGVSQHVDFAPKSADSLKAE